MGKLVVTVGAIAALGFLAYRALYAHDSGATNMTPEAGKYEPSAPKQQLENVRAKARNIEAGDQQYTDKIADETKSP